ncbi:MAG: hypothetical protein ACD_28C00430G0001, partial [uncultured bacterium]
MGLHRVAQKISAHFLINCKAERGMTTRH